MERIEIFSIHNNNIRRKQLRTFEKNISIWFIGILVSSIPILFKTMNLVLHGYAEEISFVSIFSDKDIFFSIFSIATLLLVEILLVDGAKGGKGLRIYLLGMMTILLALYTMAVFSDGWYRYFNQNIAMWINIISLASVIVVGVLQFCSLATIN